MTGMKLPGGLIWLSVAVTLLVACGPPAPNSTTAPITWELWHEVKHWKAGVSTSGTPSLHSDMAIEKNLDRSACELVKQGKVRGVQQEAAKATSFSAHEYGAIYYHMFPEGASFWFEAYSCVQAGTKNMTTTPSPVEKGEKTVSATCPGGREKQFADMKAKQGFVDYDALNRLCN